MKPANKFPYTVTRIIQYLSEPKHAIHFLRGAKIADISEVRDIHQYGRQDGRRGLVINAKEKGSPTNQQVSIDIKHGQPSTDQLCEAIYGSGTISGTRILIYTGNSSQDKENPAANYELVSRLVRLNDSYNPTYLIRAIVPESASKPIQFHVDTRSDPSSDETNSDPISERNFRELEFWNCFIHSLDPVLYKRLSPIKAENFLFMAYGHYTDVGSFEVREGFNEFGVFIWVVQRNGGGNLLTEFLRINQSKLNRQFSGAEMALETREGQSPTLTVKISNRSLRWLLSSSVAEKLTFAKELHGQYMAMVKFVRREA